MLPGTEDNDNYYKKNKTFNLSVDCQLHLFNKVVMLVFFIHGCET